MQADDTLADQFEAHRPRLRGVAYRMLGSLDEAEDAVQESWLRLSRSDSDGIENLGAWLTTVVARVCLDMLRSRTSRGEAPWDEHEVVVPLGGERAFQHPREGRLTYEQVAFTLASRVDLKLVMLIPRRKRRTKREA